MRLVFAILLGLFCCDFAQSQDLITPYEKSGKTATATYAECREWYRKIQIQYPEFTYFDSIGSSDGGLPIYVFRIYKSENAQAIKVLVMNNIHPGEPEGTDASMLLVEDILTNPKKWKSVLENIDLHIICQYNTDGTVNRGCCSRANQNGPAELGFRANAKNLDLNRDFIKCDSRNTRAFQSYFLKYKFELFVDNHTSNGADYQYTLTYFHTRPEKLHSSLVPYMQQLTTDIDKELNKKGIPTAPYVELYKDVPDSGIVAFWESGRYSTGYAALHHCIGFTVETHMFKPFPERVAVTLAFMEELLRSAADKKWGSGLYKTHRNLFLEERIKQNRTEIIRWELNEKKCDSIPFLGYAHSHKINEITGLSRLHYDRNKPWKKTIPYYNNYVAADSVVLPMAYIISRAWPEIAERLRWSGVAVRQLGKDTLMPVRASYIQSYETVKSPYESHYLHYNTRTADTLMYVQFYAGDFLVLVTNTNRAFLAAVLEPRSADSYFNWNYFDGILQQKEWFSDYVFVDKVEEIMQKNPALKTEFESEKAKNPEFARSNWAQLAWIYRHSEYYEKSHNRYPVFRLD